MSYPITQNLIPGLPKNPYRKGVSAYEGVVAHSTATPGADDVRERNFEAAHWKEAFVHFFVDWDSITQVADSNYVAWGAGPNANQRFVHVELCETPDAAKFNQSYARYTWLLAYILYGKRLGVKRQSTLWTHADVTRILGGTTHQDPVAYLQSHGVSIDKLVTDVTVEYNKMAGPTPVAKPEPIQTEGTFRIKTLPSSLWYYDRPDWNAKKATVPAGTVLTVVQTLTVSGSKMYKLKSGTYITANPKYVKTI